MEKYVVRNNSEKYFELKDRLREKGYGCDVWTRYDEVWSGRDEEGRMNHVVISKW